MKAFGFAVCLLLALLVLSVPVGAETPDGLTPAEETVCDPLKDDGVTKGLYGLCVAFCEAQDLDLIQSGDYEAMVDSAPSGRILENYNKKKQEGDPDMPCILTTECPCFTAEELTAIDGYVEGVGSVYFVALPWYEENTVGKMLMHEYYFDGSGDLRSNWIQVTQYPSRMDFSCLLYNNIVSFDPEIYRVLAMSRGTLTLPEWEKCYEMLEAEIAKWQ